MSHDWSHYTARMHKIVQNVEANMALHWWRPAREEALDMIERLKQVIACSYAMEQEETRAKYERGGWQLHRLKEADAVTRPGVCPYCGTKSDEHAEACVMWSAA